METSSTLFLDGFGADARTRRRWMIGLGACGAALAGVGVFLLLRGRVLQSVSFLLLGFTCAVLLLYTLPGWRPFLRYGPYGIAFRSAPLRSTQECAWRHVDHLSLSATTVTLHLRDGATHTLRHFGTYGQIRTAKARLADAARQHDVDVVA